MDLQTYLMNKEQLNDESLLHVYLNNDIAYTCVERNATAVASANWGVYAISSPSNTKRFKGNKVGRKAARTIAKRKGFMLAPDAELVQITTHPLIEVLTSVNEDLNGSQLMKLTQLYLETIGRAYWLIEENDVGNVVITPLKPWRVKLVRDDRGVVIGYEHRNGKTEGMGAWEPIDKDKVIDFRFIDPLDPLAGGKSPLRAAIKSLLMSSQYLEWLNNTISNRQRPDWLLIPGEDISPEEIRRNEQKIEQKFGGVNNGKPGILDKNFKPVNLSFSPTDIAPLAIRQEVVSRTAGAFGIPLPFVNPDSSTYANYETAMEDWARTAILPRLSLLEQVINENLFKLGIEDSVFILFDSPVPEDKATEIQEQTANIAKLQAATASGVNLTDNEKRSLLGLEPVAGGDELPDDPQPEPLPATEPPTPETPEKNDGEGVEPVKSFDRLLQLNRDVAQGDVARSVAINIAEAMGFAEAKHLIGFAKTTDTKPPKAACQCGSTKAKAKPKPSIEEQLRDKIAAFFKRIQPAALQRVKSVSGLSFNDSLQGLLSTKAGEDDLPDEFVPLDDWTDELADDVQPLIELGTRDAADAKAREYVRVGADPSFPSVIPAKVKEASEKRAYAFANSTMATTTKSINTAIEQVRNEIREGVLQGDPIHELTKRVEGVFEDAQQYQAERIARTETSSTVHQGQYIAAKESGIVKGFKYLVSEDACPVCQEYVGEEVSLDDYDGSGAVGAEGSLPLHPNCTCTLTEILDI